MEDISPDEMSLSSGSPQRLKRKLLSPIPLSQKKFRDLKKLEAAPPTSSLPQDAPTPPFSPPQDAPTPPSSPPHYEHTPPPPSTYQPPCPPNFEKVMLDVERRLSTRLDEILAYVSMVVKKIDSLSDRVDIISDRVDRISDHMDNMRPQASTSSPTGLELNVIDIKESPYKVNKDSIKESNIIEGYNEDYPGRMLLPQEKRDLIHKRMSSIPSKNHIAFSGWNIVAFRDSMDELLLNGYIGDCHVDAYAKILELVREKDDKLCRPFLYVSPNLWLHNQDPEAAIKYSAVKSFVSHITKTNIQLSHIILMPICRNDHWFLVVGLASKKSWVLHDSLPNAKRKEMARASIQVLQKATEGRTNTNFNDWNLVMAKGIPRQSNSVDCGVYVIKYMEHILKPGLTDWKTCGDWAEKMPLFRAEIAHDIFKYFVDESV